MPETAKFAIHKKELEEQKFNYYSEDPRKSMTDGGVLEWEVMGGGVKILNRVIKESLTAIRCRD